MRVTFGMALDGTEWSTKPVSVGEIQVGPAGFLGLLETHMGLTGLETHHAVRIDQYRARMIAYDSPAAWYHASFLADSWSTAKQFLAWRDELIEAGWDGTAEKDASPRLRALAGLERCGAELARGHGDRLREALREMERFDRLPFREIHLHEPLELFPPVWQAVVTRLEAMGAELHEAPGIPVNERGSNLAALQRRMRGLPEGATTKPGRAKAKSSRAALRQGDDSLLLLDAADEWEAAETVATWLVSRQDANETVTIICQAGTDVLDHALRRNGLPQLARAGDSRWRAALQVLPLVMANAWKPVDMQRLAELLTLSPSPVPRFAAHALLDALRKEPGIGGGEWNAALARIAELRVQREAQRGRTIAADAAAAYAAEFDAMLATDRFDPVKGIPEEALRRRCQWMIEKLAWRMEGEPLLTETVSHAREMQRLSEGKGALPRVMVERMLDSVIGTGAAAPDRIQQAAPWEVLSDPAQVTRPRGSIVWWGFTDPDTAPPTFWTADECAQLVRHGAQLESRATRRRREARGWRHALWQAEEYFLAIRPRRMRGEDTFHHPLWDEISIAAEAVATAATKKLSPTELRACIARDCCALETDGHWSLAGRTVQLEAVPRGDPAPAERLHAIGAGTIPQPEHLSATSLGDLIGCPMKWVLQRHAGLRVQETQDIPTGNKMIGTLCHRIVQEIFSEPGRTWTPDAAGKRATEIYDALVPSVAAELLHQGREVENRRVRNAVERAARTLVHAIATLKMSVSETEARREADLRGVRFLGFIDLLLRDKDGAPFVLDLKWAGSKSYKQKEILDGKALQLAAYSWLLRETEQAMHPDAAYFMLKQGDLLGSSPLLGDRALEAPYGMERTWELALRSWERRTAELNAGRLEAAGVAEATTTDHDDDGGDAPDGDDDGSPPAADDFLVLEPPCHFCDFGALCGQLGGGA